MNQEFDPAAASGEAHYGGTRALELNEVTINGDGDAVEVNGKLERKGGYFRKRILVGKPRDEKPEEVRIGTTATVVFLKVRRKLVERGEKGKIVRSTSEHNHKGDVVTLYRENEKPITGIASDLRDQYPGLRTVQIVYALLCEGTGEPELVKLIVRGSSLGSEAKAESTTDFYKYLGSFGKGADGEKEHFYQYKTVLRPVLEQGAKSYFAIHFERGERLSEKSYEYAMAKLREVHEKCVEIDEARAKRVANSDVVPEHEVEQELEEGEAKDDINPDDIPF
jgi:hypothetical protein